MNNSNYWSKVLRYACGIRDGEAVSEAFIRGGFWWSGIALVALTGAFGFPLGVFPLVIGYFILNGQRR